MILYRVSNHADLSGLGGELADGRWHTRQEGRRIVYLSDHTALCLLELLVQLGRDEEMPDSYQLLRVEIPGSSFQKLDQQLLPPDWQVSVGITQQIGNDWLAAAKHAGLLVPSVVVPMGMNCILNPLHPAAKNLKPEVIGRFPFDTRLLHR